MKTMLKRSMAILLILLMVISVLPMSAMAATVDRSYLPVYFIMSTQTSSTMGVYRLGTGTSANSYTTSNASSSTSTYYPWSPSSSFMTKYAETGGYKTTGFIPVKALKDELTYSESNKNGIFQASVYYRNSTTTSWNSSYTTSNVVAYGSGGYTWDIYAPTTKGIEIPDQQAYISFDVHIFNGEGTVVATKTFHVENPFLSEDYTLKYSVTRTYDGTTSNVASNKTFASSSADTYSDLKVVLPAVTGTSDDVYKFSSVGFNNTEYYLTYDYNTNFEKLTSLTPEESKILADSKADLLFKGEVTVTSKQGYYLRLSNDSWSGYDVATVTFYQPVKLGYIDLITIGDVVILQALDVTDASTYKWIGGATGEIPKSGNKTVTLAGTYDLTSITTSSPQYSIKVANNTNTASTRYTVRVAESEQGTCSVTSFNTGTYNMVYYPELNGATSHVIKFSILPNNDADKAITLNLTLRFAGGATETEYETNNLSYTTVAGSSVTFQLSSLVKNFAKFSDEQKAQFTFTINDFTDDDNQDFGNYFVSYQGNSSTAGVTSLTNDPNNNDMPGSSSSVDSSCFLDDYKVVYVANRNTIASDEHGFTVNLTNKTSDGVYTDTFKVKFTASEGVKPAIGTPTATLSATPGNNSSSVSLKNYISNFSADQGLTYKITSRTANYGTFYVGGTAATANATGSITASAPAIYYKANSGAASGSTDTMVITVLQNSTTVGTITYTGQVGTGKTTYTEAEFNRYYKGGEDFGVVVSSTGTKTLTAATFNNGDVDLSDDAYEDYYIEIVELPIGGYLTYNGREVEEGDSIDVEDLGSLKYVRDGATSPYIDAFDFELHKNARTYETHTMWIVPDDDYLSNVDGYTEEEFKASYGTKSGFGVYASSSGISFDADDFTNGSYKLENDYSDAYIEIVDEPVIGTLKEGSSTVGEEDRIAVADLGDLKYTWEDFDSSDIDCFTFYVYSSKSGSTKAVSTKFTMWIVGNKSLISATGENWSATGTTMPTYKVTDVEVSDNIGSVTLDADWVEEALETVKTGSEVTVAITTKTEAKGLSLTVDKSLFSLSNASKIKYITLSEGTTGASVRVSVADVLSAGGSGKDFTVAMNKLTISTANDIVANSLVASTATAARSVSFTAASANITFDNVGAALLSIPYTNSSSYDDEMVVIYDYSGGNTPLVSTEFTGRYALADISKGGQYLVAVNSISFSDVSSNWAWTRGYIPSLAARGTISGMGGQNAGKYMPDASLTRAEFIKLLVVSLGLEDNSATNPFSDMSDHWAKQVVAAAVKNGIVSSGSTFSPDTAITRKDMALYAYKAAQAAGLTLSSSGSTTTFKDENEITGDYLTAVKAMQAAGIINGMGGQYEGYYLPNNGTDRASAAKIIWFLNAMLYDWSTTGKY